MSQGSKPGDSQDELQEALRELERQRRAAPKPIPREAVQDAIKEIAEQQREEKARGAKGPSRLATLKWPIIAVLTLAILVVCAIIFRPAPLPPPAESAAEAVEGFWKATAAGNYRAATVYYPSLVDRYGSPEQAGRFLKDHFQGNPPTVVRSVKVAGNVPDSLDLIVDYEVVLRSGKPQIGQAIVTDTQDPKRGYVILSGI